MSILVVANDVTPGFGVPVAAPGLRAAGLAEGLRAHSLDVELTVPSGVLDTVWNRPMPPTPPPRTTVIDPVDLGDFIENRRFAHVVFTNANMATHLRPNPGTTYVFDMFAPKILELLSSDRAERDWKREAAKKERAMALADVVWVNGRRKVGYALGWLLRPSVDRIRTEQLGRPPLIDGDPMRHVRVVEMAVPLPDGMPVRPATHRPSTPLRVGIAGYRQRWSAGQEVSPAQRIPLANGCQVHVLEPVHWGGSQPDEEPAGDLAGDRSDDDLVAHSGPLDYASFGRWIQSMDVIADAYHQTAERTMAMITRAAVALRFGVPVIHAVDSEVSDLVREYDAGWIIDAGDEAAWKQALDEAADPGILATKQSGAARLSETRLAPASALADAAARLSGVS